MNFKNLVTSFVRSWNFTRQETLEILVSLDNSQLMFTPKGANFQPLLYQFGCIGRTQMVYTRAITEGKMDFAWFSSRELPGKLDFPSKEQMVRFLKEVDKKWIEAIRNQRQNENFVVKWPGFKRTLPNHIDALIAHERLHHGQLISYFTFANFDLPKNFKANWAL